MTLRKTIFWIHLSIGITVGTIILFMCATGILLAYRRQIEGLSDHSYRSVPIGESRLGMHSLLAIPGDRNVALTAITVHSDEAASIEFAFGREQVLYINPYNGNIVGEGSDRTRAFFNRVVELHRWLGGRSSSSAGSKITAACNFGFFFLLITGPYIWYPQKWSRRNLANIVLPRFRVSGRAREWNWHHVAGIWCAIPLLIIVLTAIPMSYGWANNLLYRITGNPPPQPQESQSRESRPGNNKTPSSTRQQNERARAVPWDPEFLDSLWKQAESRVAGWRTITMRVPAAPSQNVTFMIDSGNGGRPDRKFQLVLTTMGEMVRLESFSSYNRGRQLRFWARWIHTGEAGGLSGQTIAFIATSGGIVLSLTGLILAFRRLLKSRSLKNRHHATAEVMQVEQQEAISR